MTIPSAGLALRAAVYQKLVADQALADLLGGARIYDEPPRAAPPPYVTLGALNSTDVSGDATPAESHELTLEVWSREGGLAQALKCADRAVKLTDNAALVLDGHRLATLAWTATEALRITDSGLRRASITFRAVTEPAA